jgi:hypothetical protein
MVERAKVARPGGLLVFTYIHRVPCVRHTKNDLVYVCNIETWSKIIQVLHFSQRDPFQKEIRLALFSLKRHLNQNW